MVRNDAITRRRRARRCGRTTSWISPGPCTPNEAGVIVDVIRAFAGGCRCSACAWATSPSAQVFGGRGGAGAGARAREDGRHPARGRGVFRGLPKPFVAARYHSLVVDRASLPGAWR